MKCRQRLGGVLNFYYRAAALEFSRLNFGPYAIHRIENTMCWLPNVLVLAYVEQDESEGSGGYRVISTTEAQSRIALEKAATRTLRDSAGLEF